MSDLRVGPNTRVTLHFSLTMEDGQVIDSNFERSPATFTVGDGSLLDGFEKKLFGMAAGSEREVKVLPEEGFGQRNPNNIQQFTRKDFAADLELVEGMVISFADAAQTELPGVVAALEGDNVSVDFNHPLAGRTIVFKAKVLTVGIA